MLLFSESPVHESGGESPKTSSINDKDTLSICSQMIKEEMSPNRNDYVNIDKDICRRVLLEKKEELDLETQTDVEAPSSPPPSTSGICRHL